MLSSHREDAAKNVKVTSFCLLTLLLTYLELSQVLITTCLPSWCIQVLLATSLKLLDKMCKKTPLIVNKVTDLYFCQDLQLCQ